MNHAGSRQRSDPHRHHRLLRPRARGIYEDKGGPAVEAYLRKVLASRWSPLLAVVSDERRLIADMIVGLADERAVR